MNERPFIPDARSGPRVGQRGASGSKTRAAIFDAAFHLFLYQGYHGTSMRQVAREAAITPAAIYNHFEGKEALFIDVLTEHIPHNAVLAALSEAQGQTAHEITHDAVQRMHAAMASQFDNLRLMFIELIEFQGRHASGLVGRFLPQLLGFVERLRRADGRGLRYPDIIVARAFFGLFMSYAITVVILGRSPGFRDDPGDLADFADLFLYGVHGESTDGPGRSLGPSTGNSGVESRSG